VTATKWGLAVLAVAVLVLALVVMRPLPRDAGPAAPGAPWRIETSADGASRVFGLTLGASTLGDALAALGPDMELAVIATGDEPGSLEAYYSHATAGPVIGRLILNARLDAPTVERLRRNSPRTDRAGTGARKIRIAADDLPVALGARIEGIVFLPAVNLDEDVVIARFGEPQRRVRVDEHSVHLLYPDKGLDVVLNDDGREVLQYVAPGEFARLSAPLDHIP